jgi:sialidase-1
MSREYKVGTPKLIEEAYGEKYGLCRIPGLVVTEKKTILCYYEARSDFMDWARIDIKVLRSTDGGENFEPVLVIDGEGDTLNNPVMIVKGDVIHFLYLKNYNRLFYRQSLDDGKTFSEPREITDVLSSDGLPYTVAATGPGHGIVHNENILVPLWRGYNPDDPKAHKPTHVLPLYSDDDGERFKLGEPIGNELLEDANESAFAVSGDGKVIISIRHYTLGGKQRAIAVSENGIDGWSEPILCDTLPDPKCMGSMAHDEKAIYHVNCASQSEREDLTIKISRDNFATYESIFVSKYAGYSDIAVDGDNIYVFYERFHEEFHRKAKKETTRDENDGLYFVKIKM